MNLSLRWIALSALLLGSACNRIELWPSTPQGYIADQSMDAGGETRAFDLFVPPGQKNSPVVFLLHGAGGSKEALIGRDGKAAPYWRWISLAIEHDLILVIPNGTEPDGKRRGWNDCRVHDEKPTADDMAFMQALLEEVKANYDVDTTRIYVNGTSNGGLLAQRMAEEMPEQIAAIASVIASRPDGSSCDTSSMPVSILYMNGTEDKILPYDGGEVDGGRGLVLSTDASVAYWVARNGTDVQPETTDFPDRDDNDKSTVHRDLYRNGRLGTEVALYRVEGAGHAEPSRIAHYGAGYRRIAGGQNYDIEMADEIWGFFHDKRR